MGYFMEKRTSGLIATVLVFGLISALTASSVAAQSAVFCDGLPATIVGTAGADTIDGTPGPDVIAGLQGNDVINGAGGDDVICGGQGNDVLRGGQGFDVIFGAQGNDVIYAATGVSAAERVDVRGARMFGGAGDDMIHGSDRWDRMQGGVGLDQLFGYEGRDWMRAGAQSDFVDGGPGIDDLHGGNGNDTLTLTAGDTARGGAGFDLCSLEMGRAERLISCGLNEREAGAIADSAFIFEHEAGDTWTGEIFGVVDAEVSSFANVTGRCFLVLGVLTPGEISNGSPISNPFTIPQMGVTVGGTYFEDGVECNSLDAEDRGYDWVLEAYATAGTDIPFYAEIFLPDNVRGQIDAFIVGDPETARGTLSLPAPSLSILFSPASILSDGLRVGLSLPDGPPLGLNAGFTHDDGAGNAWEGRVVAIETADVAPNVNFPGRCFLVIGELFPTAIAGGQVADPFTSPDVGLVANGRYARDAGGVCDTSGAEARGIGDRLDAEVPLNTPYQFYSSVFIPEVTPGAIEHVVIGTPSVPAPVTFSLN